MKRILISILFSASVFTAASQTSCSIKKAYAYYTVSVPGIQMSDDNGNPIPVKPAIGRFIYFEWSGPKKPGSVTVLYNNKALVATLTAIAGRSVTPGSEINQNNVSKITVKKTNSLWKIDLLPKEGCAMPDQDCKNISIKIKGTKKTCTFRLFKETELMNMPRY